jgi:signal transduction histidine kinase/CheY-like chemotaxis protein
MSWETRVPYREGGERDVHIDYIPDRGNDGRVRGFFVLVQDIGERKAAERQLDDANSVLRKREALLASEAAALAKLNEASSRLWRLTDLREGLEEILDATIELLGADKGTVQVLDEHREVLTIVAQRGFDTPFLEFFREVTTADLSASARTLRARVRTIIEDVEADSLYAPLRPVARAAGYRAVQTTPLIGRRGTPLGMLSTHWRTVHVPTEHDLRRLDLYARQASDFIERCASDDALREVDARKDAFLATLSHELRNPLAPIRQSIAILNRPDVTASGSRQAREVIDRQSRHMSVLLDDLLDVTRISRGTLTLQTGPTKVDDIVAAAVEVAGGVVQSQGHTLVVDIQPKFLSMSADAVRLSQVLSNLLLNAAKYTDPGGVIKLLAAREDGEVVFRVADNGIGISAEELPRVFEMFTQAPAAIGRAQGGLGVGLALVRAIVELHGGTVEARSDGPGRGSEFIVRLPLREAAAGESAPSFNSTAATRTPSLKVLVADDNHDAAETLQMILAMDGHDVRICHDGREALKAMESSTPDVAILDIGMPELDGLEVAERVRSASWGRNVRLIALSGWGQEEDVRRSAAAGFDHHLTKPVDPEVLQPLILGAGKPE